MTIETGNNAHDTNADTPQTADTTQPDQAVLQRREYQRKRYQQNPQPKLASNRRWRQQNPDKAHASNRQWTEKNPDKAAAASRRTSLRYFNKNRQRLYDERREQRRQQKEAAQTGQQATEQSGNIPPINPIFDRLSQALATQQATERQHRTRRRKTP